MAIRPNKKRSEILFGALVNMAERYTELQFYLHCDGFRIQILSMNHVRFGQNFNYK